MESPFLMVKAMNLVKTKRAKHHRRGAPVVLQVARLKPVAAASNNRGGSNDLFGEPCRHRIRIIRDRKLESSQRMTGEI